MTAPPGIRIGSLPTALLVVLLACGSGPISIDEVGESPQLTPSAVSRTLVLADEGFEATPLGGEPYPFIAETWCAESFVGASEDVARSGSRSFQYRHDCDPGIGSTMTTLSFSQCTHFPLAARVAFHRQHAASGSSFFSLNSYVSEPRTALLFADGGGIYVSDGVGPDILVGLHNAGAWTSVESIWDFDAGTFDLFIDGSSAGTFPTYVTKAFWLGFGTGDPGTTFYDDDVSVSIDVRGERAQCTGIEPLPWPWPPPEGQLGG